jgi:hypothetical protein
VKDDFGFFPYELTGTATLDAASGEYRVTLQEPGRSSRFRFDSVAAANGRLGQGVTFS